MKKHLRHVKAFFLLTSLLWGAGIFTHASATEEILVRGHVGAEFNYFDWYNDMVQPLMLMQQRQADSYSEFMRAQQYAQQREAQAEQAFSQCMGYAGMQHSVCTEAAAKNFEKDINTCGGLLGNGATAGVELSFGVITISAALSGSERINHCK